MTESNNMDGKKTKWDIIVDFNTRLMQDMEFQAEYEAFLDDLDRRMDERREDATP